MKSLILLPLAAALASSPLQAAAPPAKPTESKVKALATAPASAPKAQATLTTAPVSEAAWHVSAGFIWRNLGNLNFNTNPRAQGFFIPSLNAPAQPYRDGFVSADASTSSTGETWFWGYTNNSQLNGSDLAFSGTAVSESRRFNTHPGWSDDVAGGGPIITVNWDTSFPRLPGVRVGAEFSVSLIQADAEESLNTMRVLQQSLRITDHYTVDPLSIPGAPFTGTFDGPGPIIPATPSQRDITGVNNTLYFDDVRESLDLTLTTLSLGPTASYHRDRLKATLGLGLALNIASWDADKTDTLYVERNGHRSIVQQSHDGTSGTDVLPGFYLQASLAYAMDAHWSVQAFGRYDWSRALEGEVGGSSFHLDLTGWSIGAGLTYRF